MPAETVDAILQEIQTLWPVSPGVEITLEANPTSIEIEKFAAFKQAGINRVSIGIQALNAKDLAFLGRKHNVDEALSALSIARDIFPRFSFDLIYARPEQSLKDWESELAQALHFAKGHISLYQLTIEPGTAFYHSYSQGQFELPPEELAADMFELTDRMTMAHNLHRYEVSNHALPGEESRHNLAYWYYEDYIGVGPGAHGRIVPDESGIRIATQAEKHPETWLEHVQKYGHAITVSEPLSPQEQAEECLMMGMRLAGGISHAHFTKRTGQTVFEAVSPTALKRLTDQGLLINDRERLCTTPRGMLLLNRIISELLGITS